MDNLFSTIFKCFLFVFCGSLIYKSVKSQFLYTFLNHSSQTFENPFWYTIAVVKNLMKWSNALLYKTIGSLRVVEKAGNRRSQELLWFCKVSKKKLKLEEIKKVLFFIEKKTLKITRNSCKCCAWKAWKKETSFFCHCRPKNPHDVCSIPPPNMFNVFPLWVQLLVVPNIFSLQKTNYSSPQKLN